MLLLRTLVIFFSDGHGFILKRSIFMNVPFIWGMSDMKWSSNLWYKDKPVRINKGWRRKYKRRNINCRRKRNLRKRKGRKDKVDGKGIRETRFNRRPPMFSCIRLRKRQQCFKPKIGGETLVTTKVSSESSKDQIQYMTMCERSIMWYCSHELLSSSFEIGMASFSNAQSWWTFPLFEPWGTWNEAEIYHTKSSQ